MNTLDQIVVQLSEAASGTENPRLLAQSFATETSPDITIIANQADWPSEVAAAIAVVQTYCETLINQE